MSEVPRAQDTNCVESDKELEGVVQIHHFKFKIYKKIKKNQEGQISQFFFWE